MAPTCARCGTELSTNAVASGRKLCSSCTARLGRRAQGANGRRWMLRNKGGGGRKGTIASASGPSMALTLGLNPVGKIEDKTVVTKCEKEEKHVQQNEQEDDVIVSVEENVIEEEQQVEEKDHACSDTCVAVDKEVSSRLRTVYVRELMLSSLGNAPWEHM